MRDTILSELVQVWLSAPQGFRPVRQICSRLSHSLGDIPVSGERIKMEKEIYPEGPEGDADAACGSSGGSHGALQVSHPWASAAVCSEGGSLQLFAKSFSDARFWR